LEARAAPIEDRGWRQSLLLPLGILLAKYDKMPDPVGVLEVVT
jgi:hypothetical protein